MSVGSYPREVATMSNAEQSQNIGSNPCRTAIFAEEHEDVGCSRTTSAQNPPESTQIPAVLEKEADVRFPKVVRNKKSKVEVTVYGKKRGYAFYRVCWRAGRQRRMKSFASYSAARKFADETLRSIAKGSQATALTARACW